MALFLVSSNMWVSGVPKEDRGILGGPVRVGEAATDSEGFFEGRAHTTESLVSITEEDRIAYDSLFGPAVEAGGGVLRGPAAETGVISYTVRNGDTLSGIAARFGISLQTLLGVNPGLRPFALQIGDTITVLPVSGILYEVREGETPDSVASLFSLSVSELKTFNRSVDWTEFGPGTSLVIPGAKPVSWSYSGRLPDIVGYYIQPAKGFNWGQLHNYNAVDIANSCGVEVAAAAEGLVAPDANYGDGASGWNGGHGKFVLLEHPNGTKTRYSHLQTIAVSIGQYVKQGEKIGTIGNTGNVHGPTGCHLHFEVHGARNPFAK